MFVITRVGLRSFKTGFKIRPQATQLTNNDVEGYVTTINGLRKFKVWTAKSPTNMSVKKDNNTKA